MKKPFTITVLLLALIANIASCGSQPVTVDDTEELTTEVTTAPEEPEYEFADLDMQGADFTILNPTTTWGFYTYIDFEEATGDVLDDTIYERNSKLEELYNFNTVVVEEDIDSMTPLITNAVMAGDNSYQVTFPRCTTISALITDGYFYDLSKVPELQLDKPWWDQNVIEVSSLGPEKTLYYAATDFSLTGFDGTICIFINEDMLSDLGGEMPYQLVRDGKWTLDEYYSIMKLGASLNGDDSYTWNATGSCTYGLLSWNTGPSALLIGAGAEYISLDDQGYPVIGFESEHFTNAAEKVASMLATPGEWLELNTNQDPDHYEVAFRNGRCLSIIAEIKASTKFREMEDLYGIVPLPKYDESQEKYRTYRAPVNPLMCIPVTNPDISEAALIMDAFSYMTYKDVLPVYYDVSLSQKGLRNEDSIEMLDIIRDTRYFDISQCYGWTNTLYSAIEGLIMVGNGAIASTIASNKEAVNVNIKKTLELLEDIK